MHDTSRMQEIDRAQNVVKDMHYLVHAEFQTGWNAAQQLSEVSVSTLHDDEHVSELESLQKSGILRVNNDIVNFNGVISSHLSQVPHDLNFGDQLPRLVGRLKYIFQKLDSNYRLSGLLSSSDDFAEAAHADNLLNHVVFLNRGPDIADFFHYSAWLEKVILQLNWPGNPTLLYYKLEL